MVITLPAGKASFPRVNVAIEVSATSEDEAVWEHTIVLGDIDTRAVLEKATPDTAAEIAKLEE